MRRISVLVEASLGSGGQVQDAHQQQQQTLRDNLIGRSVAMGMQRGRRLNPGILKKRKWAFFQTVNNSKIIWDPNAKPKGLLGGHLNIRSILPKIEQKSFVF